MYVNAFVLGVLATLIVEMDLVIGVAVCYGIYEIRHSYGKKRG